MDWDSATKFVIEGTSFLALVVVLLISFLRQLPELAEEWRRVRRAFWGPSEDNPRTTSEPPSRSGDDGQSN